MTKTYLEVALKVNTAKGVENAVHELVGQACLGLTLTKEKFVILPNWKFKTEKEAVEFRAIADGVLKMNTKEEFRSARIFSKHEGHLLMVICWRTTENEFDETVQAVFGGGTFTTTK